MLSPAGAFIQAIIATYNTIMFFVERMRTIMQVAMSFVNSIAAIAAGTLSAAARRVETTMAGLLTLVISFLARIAGLGRVADAVTRIINRVRRPIDRALDRVVGWIVAQARRLGRFVAQAGVPQDPQERVRLAARAAIAAAQRLRGRISRSLLAPLLAAIRTRYGLRSVEPFERDGKWWVRIVNSPATEVDTGVATSQQNNTALPDRVQVLSSGGSVMIDNYSRSSRTGTFNGGIFSGSVTLNKLKHAPVEGQTGDKVVDASSSATVEYTISAANGLYGTVSGFQAVDRSDPDEAASYANTREAFPEVMRNWWLNDSNDSRIPQLHSAGLVDIAPTGLVRGSAKWHYIYSLLSAQEKTLLTGPVNKENMTAVLSGLPANRRDALGQAWKQRWSSSTQIHHIKPINFGGGNENFVPLKADKHVGSQGVHPRFWTPLKRFLMGLR
jgi:DNA-binding transcriptional regulator YdaS (Cro superfamily)